MMQTVRGYRELIAWQKAMDLADRVYDVTETWPSREMFGLTSQTRRSAVSVPANIAEGQGRESLGDFARFLTIAYGSLNELETHLYLAERREYLNRPALDELISQSTEVARIIRGLIKNLRSRSQIRVDEPPYDSPDVV